MSDYDIDDDALEEARRELNGQSQSGPRAFIYACKLSEIPQNGNRGKVIVCEHDEIALFLIQGKIHAISNMCPHENSPVLASGFVDKTVLLVTCPLHGWVFEIQTGRMIGGGGYIDTYEVKIVEDEVWVEEPKKK
jgi:NAD(P)H-dependent nitrite reductase small subunit